MPMLEAEEALRVSNATALGSGTLKKADAKRLHGDLERAARATRTGPRKKAPPLTPEMAAMFGVGIRSQSRKLKKPISLRKWIDADGK